MSQPDQPVEPEAQAQQAHLQGAALICPRCGLPASEWCGDREGALRNNDLYCCRGCAEGSACECIEEDAPGTL
jgi:hypothetical protein